MLGYFYRWAQRDPSLRAGQLNLHIRWVTEGSLVPGQQEERAGVVASELQSDDFGWIPALLLQEFAPRITSHPNLSAWVPGQTHASTRSF